MNVERLKLLYQIIDGIPDSQVDLKLWRTTDHERDVDCGTIACAVGFAACHPEFNAQGLTFGHPGELGRQPKFKNYQGWDAVEKFFKLDHRAAWALFYKHGAPLHFACREEDLGPPMTDKQKALRRIRRLLTQHGAITPERNIELAKLQGVKP